MAHKVLIAVEVHILDMLFVSLSVSQVVSWFRIIRAKPEGRYIYSPYIKAVVAKDSYRDDTIAFAFGVDAIGVATRLDVEIALGDRDFLCADCSLTDVLFAVFILPAEGASEEAPSAVIDLRSKLDLGYGYDGKISCPVLALSDGDVSATSLSRCNLCPYGLVNSVSKCYCSIWVDYFWHQLTDLSMSCDIDLCSSNNCNWNRLTTNVVEPAW